MILWARKVALLGHVQVLLGEGTVWEIRLAVPASRQPAGQIPEAQALEAFFQAYADGVRRPFPLPLAWERVTRFQKTVYDGVCAIPWGEVRSYQWVADRLQAKKKQSPVRGMGRAVGQALARNPFPIVVPCHRVVASHGRVGGFSCGVALKMRLLMHEQGGGSCGHWDGSLFS